MCYRYILHIDSFKLIDKLDRFNELTKRYQQNVLCQITKSNEGRQQITLEFDIVKKSLKNQKLQNAYYNDCVDLSKNISELLKDEKDICYNLDISIISADMGWIIGKNRSNIKNFDTKESQIYIENIGTLTDDSYQIMRLQADTIDILEPMIRHIFDSLKKIYIRNQDNYQQKIYGNQKYIFDISITEESKKHIIGKEGVNIKSAKIKFDSYLNIPKEDTNKHLHVETSHDESIIEILKWTTQGLSYESQKPIDTLFVNIKGTYGCEDLQCEADIYTLANKIKEHNLS